MNTYVCVGIPFDAWCAIWLSGLFEHGRWSDWVAGWRSEYLNNADAVIWLKYEDLVANPHDEVKRLAAFLDLPLQNDDLIGKVVRYSGFSSMKQQAGGSSFFRSGIVGDSKRHFSGELKSKFDLIIREQMRGIDDPYR